MLSVSLLFVFVHVFHVASTTDNLPPGCFSSNKIMSCGSLNNFPTFLPRDIEGVVIYDMEASSIPEHLFKVAPNLNSIQIYFGKIGKISKNSFANAAHKIKDISFFQSDIRTIEAEAFTNIAELGYVSFHNMSIGEIQGNAFSNIQNLKRFSMSICNVAIVRKNALNVISKIGQFQILNSHFGLLEVNALNHFGSIENFGVHENYFDMFKCMSLEPLLSIANSSAFFENTFSCSCDLQWLFREKVTQSYLFSNWCEHKANNTKINLNEYDFEKAGCSAVDDSCSESFSVTIATQKQTFLKTTMATTNERETDREQETSTFYKTSVATKKHELVQAVETTAVSHVQTENINVRTTHSRSTERTSSKYSTTKGYSSSSSQSVTSGNVGSPEGSTKATSFVAPTHTEKVTVRLTNKPKHTDGTNGAESVKRNHNIIVLLVVLTLFSVLPTCW